MLVCKRSMSEVVKSNCVGEESPSRYLSIGDVDLVDTTLLRVNTVGDTVRFCVLLCCLLRDRQAVDPEVVTYAGDD